MVKEYLEASYVIKDFIWIVQRDLMNNKYRFPDNHAAGIEALEALKKYMEENNIVFINKDFILENIKESDKNGDS